MKKLLSAIVLVTISSLILAGCTPGKTNKNKTNTINTKNGGVEQESEVKIEHIGINLAPYDPETNTVGDIVFTEETLSEYDMPYFDYGFQVEASSAGPARKNPQPTFIVPLGTKVHSLVDGVVVNVPKLYSDDYSIHVQASEDSEMIFELEHVINVTVKVGDTVKAGDVLGEVSDYDAHNYAGLGLYEIGILIPGNPPSHICPFLYLDDSIKDETNEALLSLYKAWNEYRGKQIYDENLETPGCITTEEISE
jgi:hypothetical protein